MPLPSEDLYAAGAALVELTKAASTHALTYALAGRLVLSRGWLVLTVPAAIVRGAYDALHEPGAVLPDILAIPVMTPQELTRIGDPDKITERGKQYRYSLGTVRSHEPGGSVSKVFYVRVLSPELRKLRHSYGLSAYPKGESFQLPIGIRQAGVLGNNEQTKLAACLEPIDSDVFDVGEIQF